MMCFDFCLQEWSLKPFFICKKYMVFLVGSFCCFHATMLSSACPEEERGVTVIKTAANKARQYIPC